MAVSNLFSKRQKKLRGEVPDVYQYTDLSSTLRVQVVHIIKDTIGKDKGYYSEQNIPEEIYYSIHKKLCKEYGLFALVNTRDIDKKNILDYFLQTTEVERAIDVIEICFKYINGLIRSYGHEYEHSVESSLTPDEAIVELNERFKEHGFGYQFESNEIIRVDSSYTHSEIVKPALNLLWDKKFSGANEEYLKAHEHYRHGRNKECLNDCLKSFESIMKTICKEKNWTFNPTDTASKLIQTCFQNGLIPSYTQNQFSSLQNILTSGIPTIRNKLGGHGQGQVPQKVDDDITRYALNLTGANILLLVEQSGL